MEEEIRVSLNISGFPASLLSRLDKIDPIRSRAVIIAVKKGLKALEEERLEPKKGK